MGSDSKQIVTGFVNLLDGVPSLQSLECGFPYPKTSFAVLAMNNLLQQLSSPAQTPIFDALLPISGWSHRQETLKLTS